ncbi:protein of unknown function [Thermanaeromonas toyohensis ToBE]|uniref:DUF4342 domain-containing protein n=1 Tax=Thermanaeromonas toyohensis ToBE TaxID=698762 RepID=A0A1W1VI51_9FIRM|nr:DUF4342 domain-containing protein [Thermanaeromonas toyohensis]SMB93006.1 protein of unknown function [Thermanaeromonas toyohensis ToBE]
MSTELDKIDILRKRLGLTYREAKKALDEAGGDVIEALIRYEEGKKSEVVEQIETWSSKILARIKEILQKGQATKIKIKKDGKTVAEIPATAGALGVLGVLASTELAILAGISTVAALFNRYTLEIERPGGQVEEHALDLRDKEQEMGRS